MTRPDSKRAARAIADVTGGTILASVEIAAAPERVFAALTTPEQIVRWWGSAETYRTQRWTSDLRVHGKYRAEGVGADGAPFSVEGEFLEIDPPRKLVQTWRPDWDGGHVTTLTYTLEQIERGTRVLVRHEGFGERTESCRSHGAGWELVLGWLAAHAAEPAPAEPAKYFLCRLLPPRPSFALDMNADERAVMMEHVGYWQQHMQAGKVVVFGPVGDPKGPWGLGVVRAADDAEINAFTGGDPAIRSGRGFQYEVLPMLNALLPG